VIVDVRTHLDLFDLLRLLALALLVGLFLSLIFEAADVEELGDRRIGARADLHQVETDTGGLLDRLLSVHHAQIFAILSLTRRRNARLEMKMSHAAVQKKKAAISVREIAACLSRIG
jgi:hypothetical protein